MKTITLISALACFCAAVTSCAQGTLQITFDGPPLVPPNTGVIVANYFESGMSFTATNPITHNVTFTRIGGGFSDFPDDGTAYIQGGPSTLMFSITNGSLFGLLSVDLAEYSTVFSNEPVTVPFLGYQQGGGIVTNVFTTDGIIDGTGPLADFQTFYFTNFTGLSRVEIPTSGWSLDNLVISTPEPTSSDLLLVGGLALGLVKLLNRRKELRQYGGRHNLNSTRQP